MPRGTKAARGVSAALVEQHADELLRLIAGGATMKQACASDPKFPAANIFAVQIRINPSIRDRYLEVKAAWKLNRSPSGRYFDRIIALIESGMSIAEACSTDPAFPNADTFYQITIRHPDRCARLAEAMKARDSCEATRGHRRFTEAEYDAALQAIKSCSAPSITEVLKFPLPNQNTILARCARDPEFAARYSAAMDARDDPRLHRPEAYARALDLIEANPATPIKDLLERSETRLPSAQTLNWKIRNDADLAARASVLRLKRAHGRWQLSAEPVYAENALASSLAVNQYYAIAAKAVSKGLDPTDREDIISEMVLAMISNELSVDQAAQAGREFAHRFFHPQNRQKYVSLDQPAYGEDGSRIPYADTFSADNWVAA